MPTSEELLNLSLKVNLVCSCLSATATLAVLLFMAITYARGGQSVHFTRTALLVSLFVADFVNASTTGIAAIKYLRRELTDGSLLCEIQGFLGQWSIQASDLSTLFLALTTHLITRASRTSDLALLQSRLRLLTRLTPALLLLTWLLPLATAVVGLKTVGMALAGG
ncbi:hypothetical protein HDU96_008498, partial [Phlyctochytrium bullatum]